MEYIDVTKIMQAFLTHVNSNRNLSFLFGAGISIDYVPAIDDITLNVEKNLIASGRKKEIKAWGLLKVEANDKKMDFSIELVFSLLSNKLIAVGREVLLEMTYTELENFQKHLITLFNTEICKNIKPDKDGLFDSIIDTSPHLRFAEWVSQRNTSKGLEIFTPNYDYLLELSLESQKIRYFDGFSGGFIPYFDVGSIENLDYRTSDIKLWKIHGSLGWCNQKGNIVKSSLDKNKIMILPSALKYDETKKVPYAILLDRLAASLRSNETTLIICGYSFGDDHINDLIINSLRSNRNAQVFAFVYDEQILKKGE
ncbi:MAG TPA: SIR2 family protein, partial [Anaerovoracaceae bacterium]|nr:SIR2 family protein [Anaerovoracaceae bacterium]